jgi:glycosyltransferase involved in cell wall biosynthesis
MSDASPCLSVIILCKDEEQTIGHCLAQVCAQTLLARPGMTSEILVVANGCSDGTAARARQFAASIAGRSELALHVHDLPQGGKSRSWNRAVHELSAPGAATLLFIDSDIDLADDGVFARIFDALTADGHATACAGYPMKSVARQADPGVVDRFSLAVSNDTRHCGAISGSLYIIRGETVRTIWLPDETPGEDGFVNAMVRTDGFSRPEDEARVLQSATPTHYFKEHSASGFVAHERRMIVGTVINRWLFEHLWSLRLTTPAGPLICDWNAQNPLWVQQVIDRNARGRRWLIPQDMMLGRLRASRGGSIMRRLARVPLGVAATLLTLPPAILANRTLKLKGAAGYW